MNEYIEYEQVVSSAKELKDCARKMQEIFDEVSGNMQTMTNESNFKGTASTRLQEEFRKKKSEFDEYVSAVNRFAELFEKSSEALRETEKVIENAAEGINV